MMATENNSIAELIKEDVLTCPICLEIFDEPKTLPCFHTYCRNCLASLPLQVKHKKNLQLIRCPECRRVARISEGGVDDFHTSFFINRALEIYNTKRQLVTCTVCRKKQVNQPAQSKCVTCGDTLCDECDKGHKQSSQTIDHTVISLSDFATGRFAENQRTFPCQDHQKELEYYCSTCQMVVCLTCLLVNHKDHDFKTVKQAYTEIKDKLGDKLKGVKKRMKRLEEAKVRITKLKASVETKVADTTHEISETGKNIISAVEKEVRRRKSQLKSEGREKINRLKTSLEMVANVLKNDPSSVSYLDTVLSTGEPVEILEFDTLLKYKIDLLTQVETNDNPDVLIRESRIENLVVASNFKSTELGIFEADPIKKEEEEHIPEHVQEQVQEHVPEHEDEWNDAQETIEPISYEKGDYPGIVGPQELPLTKTGMEGAINIIDASTHINNCILIGSCIIFTLYSAYLSF